ncbi:UNVERIFIED_CONTAM: hypothetical protein Sradi_0015300 [Sesamum radiatum]|uniref:Uncharacterized protein n=1 Tax=Sesamum radiatum TaxID=300843 RepID=A0AAW2WG10_SESRA
MERFQHSLETINRRFHRVLSALCAMAPELITRPSFTETHARITNNPDFYPFFKRFVTFCDIAVGLHRSYGWHVGTGMGPRVDQNRYRSRKGGLAQNVLAICDFDMNFTYVYAGWEGSAADARVWTMRYHMTTLFPFLRLVLIVERGITYLSGEDKVVHMEPHRTCLTMHIQDMAYRRYLETAGFPQDLHWTLNVEQRFMWMIVDDNTRAPMRDDAIAEAQMGIFYDIETFVMVFPSELRPRASRVAGVPVEDQGAAEDNESINLLRSPVRGGVDAPIVISDSAAPSVQTHTHIASWDAVEHVARGDGGPQMPQYFIRRTTQSRHGLGSRGIGSWTDYIRHFGMQSDPGAQTNSDGDSTARSRRPQGLPPRPRDGP